MIPNMTLARCQTGIGRATLCPLIFTIFSILPAFANSWDTKGAERAFEEAGKKRSEISQAPQPSLDQYLECVESYRRVHIKDPHYRRTGDAIYEEALLYQEMGDRFADPAFYRTAVKRFGLLIKDYGRNRNCPDALLRMGNIYLFHLNKPDAAREAFQRIRINYRNSAAFSQLPRDETDSKTTLSSRGGSTAPDARSAERTYVHSIRHWSTDEYTRVVIDMDSDAEYRKGRLSGPHRIYFDISNSKLSEDLKNCTITVDDELLKQVRVAQNRPDAVRIVLDLSEAGSYSTFALHNPFRIIIDLNRKTAAASRPKQSQPESGAQTAETGQKPAAKQSPASMDSLRKNPEASAPIDTNRQAETVRAGGLPANRLPLPAARTEASIPRDKKPSPIPNGAPDKVKSPVESTFPQENAAKAKPDLKQPSLLAENKGFKTQAPPLAVTNLDPLPAVPANEVKPAAPSSAPEIKPDNTAKAREKTEEPGAKFSPAITPVPPGAPKAAPRTSNGDRTLTRTLGLKVGRVAIDPGHGSHDWGSIGPGGLLEKDLVLSLALQLRALLEEKLGAEVVLTRSDDSFVSLEERTAIANRHRADLFISVHANSSRSRSTSGIETYYLDFAASEAEREVAARENAASSNTVYDLENLVKRIAQADKSMESRELASIIQKRLFSGTRKLFPTAKNRGVRKAPFIVLIGANMPSVLVEVAFISNPKDERLLSKAANQKVLTAAMYSGVEDYIKSLGVEVVQNQPNRNR